ncbi:phiSA1p31-related protein [Streptomyces sp. NPDC020490]|uniref:phiSA1p31-related protein n=1 Tax=Streptomyces sp. NPDC020490 TaxID=3365078 RepID=UPI003790D34D
MGTSFQTPTITRTPQVVSLHKAPLPTAVFVDRDGDVWHATGLTPGGELLLACPHPLNPEDQGVGESFPWTLRSVRASFGPLIARTAVAV